MSLTWWGIPWLFIGGCATSPLAWQEVMVSYPDCPPIDNPHNPPSLKKRCAEVGWFDGMKMERILGEVRGRSVRP